MFFVWSFWKNWELTSILWFDRWWDFTTFQLAFDNPALSEEKKRQETAKRDIASPFIRVGYSKIDTWNIDISISIEQQKNKGYRESFQNRFPFKCGKADLSSMTELWRSWWVIFVQDKMGFPNVPPGCPLGNGELQKPGPKFCIPKLGRLCKRLWSLRLRVSTLRENSFETLVFTIFVTNTSLSHMVVHFTQRAVG